MPFLFEKTLLQYNILKDIIIKLLSSLGGEQNDRKKEAGEKA